MAHLRRAYSKSLYDQRHLLPHSRAQVVSREYESIVDGLAYRNEWDKMTREPRWELALRTAGVENGELAVKLSEGYLRHYYDGVSFLPGAERLLESASHFKNCLITNGDSQHQWGKIDLLDIGSKVDQILVSGDLGIRKPDPRIFEQALDLTDTEPSESVMIGDSLHTDIAGAAAVGIGTIWINRHGYSLEEASHRPDAIISHPAEAALLIEKAKRR